MAQRKTYHERLGTLLDNARSASCVDVRDIDWDSAGCVSSQSDKDFLAKTVNRLYHGELVTAQACATLSRRIGDSRVQAFLEHQAADEERHARLFLTYMRRLGLHPKDDLVSQEIAGAISVWRGHPTAVVAGLNIALEGAALDIQLKLAKDAACPVFARLNREIARDEARHLAFGKIYLSETLPDVDPLDRQWILVWLRHVWTRASEHAFQDLPGAKALPRWVRGQIIRRGWRRTQQTLADVGLAA